MAHRIEHHTNQPQTVIDAVAKVLELARSHCVSGTPTPQRCVGR
ncbi:MAG TPA: hypothetical protein VGK74_07465 [Symbiobacteriaceae bacterium]|jgi:hypothetical protein